jgi:hypothetical protein
MKGIFSFISYLQKKKKNRYFTGVQGVKGQEGELFGIANLFADLESDTTSNILDRTSEMYRAYRIEQAPEERLGGKGGMRFLSF